MLAKDKLIVVDGEVSIDDYSGGYRMQANEVMDIDTAREQFARRLIIGVEAAGRDILHTLEQTLAPFREGACPVRINYRNGNARAAIDLGSEWCVRPTQELVKRLKQAVGEERVRLQYGRVAKRTDKGDEITA